MLATARTTTKSIKTNKKTTTKRRVGRPSKDRVKVGLSLARGASEKLIDLAYLKGQTKSELMEEAIEYFYKKEKKLKYRIENDIHL